MDKKLNKPKQVHFSIKPILITIIILLLIIITCALFYCLLLLKSKHDILDKNEQAIIKDEQIVEYGTSLSYDEIINKLIIKDKFYEGTEMLLFVNDSLMNDNYTYLFNAVGDTVIRIKTSTNLSPFFNRHANITYEVTWKVQDTKKPVLTGVNDIEITAGDLVNLKSNMSATDEIDGKLDIVIEGEFDTNKAGEYILNAKAIDKNKNETSQTFKLIVKPK